MAPLVIDASAAVHVASSEQGFETLAHYDLAAPPLVRSEVASAIHQALWRGQASPELAQGAFRAFLDAPIDASPRDGVIERAWAIADQLGWARTYDAEYVALALMLNCPLLSIDARLQRGAGHLISFLNPLDL